MKASKTLRKWAYLSHLWIGIFLCLYFSLLGLTGSALMFKVELHKLLKPRLLSVQVPADKHHASLDKIALNFGYAYRAKVASMTLPMTDTDPLVIGFLPAPKSNGKKNEWRQCYVNPYTGALLGDEITGGQPFHFLRDLHAVLLLDNLGTNIQRVGVVFLITLLLSGLWLWMPSPAHFWQQFKQRTTIRPNASFGKLNFDIHNAVGFYSSSLLLMFCFTVCGHLYHEQVLAVVSAITGTSVESGKFPDPEPTRLFSYDRVLATAKDAVPGYLPAIVTDNEHVLFAESDSHMVFPTMVNVTMDKTTSAIQKIERPESVPINKFIVSWMMPIHYGHWGRGFFYFVIKSIWFLTGFCPLILSITGVILYLRKHKNAKKKQSRDEEKDAQQIAHGNLSSSY